MQGPPPVKHGSVAVGAPVTGAVQPDPRLVLKGQHWDWPGVSRAATTTMTLDDIEAAAIVPVKKTTDNCCLRQATTDGWDRLLWPAADLEKSPVFLPVTISARNAWHLGNGKLEVFDSGYVVDGACRLEAACRHRTPTLIPAIILFDLKSDDELQLRSQLIHPTRVHPPTGPPPTSIDTSTPRLVVSHHWITVTVESEPFVVPTGLGYAPAILVRRPGATQREHLLIGAKSLGKPLEILRRKCHTLRGQTVKMRKMGQEKKAIYQLQPQD